MSYVWFTEIILLFLDHSFKQSSSTQPISQEINNVPQFQYLHMFVPLNIQQCVIPVHMHDLIYLCTPIHTLKS